MKCTTCGGHAEQEQDIVVCVGCRAREDLCKCTKEGLKKVVGKIALTHRTRVFEVEYEGEMYCITETYRSLSDTTDTEILDKEGEEVVDPLYDILIKLVEVHDANA